MALQAQRLFWQVLLHDSVAFKSLQSSFVVMNAAEKQAAQIYRRVLERYPGNGAAPPGSSMPGRLRISHGCLHAASGCTHSSSRLPRRLPRRHRRPRDHQASC